MLSIVERVLRSNGTSDGDAVPILWLFILFVIRVMVSSYLVGVCRQTLGLFERGAFSLVASHIQQLLADGMFW
jgi:hypothetical protein